MPTLLGERKATATARYRAAAHAVQAGVKTQHEIAPTEAATTPWSLRVGVNMGMVDHAALAGLLIQKGLITEIEYVEALADAAEDEKVRYERELSARTGAKVTLV